jgi:hypothetical protein
MGGTHRISWYLTDIAKGDVLPAVIDAVSATIRAKLVHSDEDGLGDHRLPPCIGPTWRYGGARGEINWQEFDPISRLHVSPPPKKRKSDSFPFLLTGKREKEEEEGRKGWTGVRACNHPCTPPPARMARHPLLNAKKTIELRENAPLRGPRGGHTARASHRYLCARAGGTKNRVWCRSRRRLFRKMAG